MNAYTTAAAAVAASIAHDEIARLALPEDIPGREDREEAALADLRELGMEDYARENDGSIDAWGTDDEGSEWRVRTVDGLTTLVRYV